MVANGTLEPLVVAHLDLVNMFGRVAVYPVGPLRALSGSLRPAAPI